VILVVAEHKDGKLKKSALELVSAANTLADALGAEVAGLVLGEGVEGVADELATFIQTVYLAEHGELAEFRAEPYTAVVSEVAREKGAKAVLVAASRAGLSYGPRVALRLDAPLLEDVVDLEVDGGALLGKRFSYLSRVTETVRAEGAPVVVSVKPNLYPVAQGGASGQVERVQARLSERDARVKVLEKSGAGAARRVALEEAHAVVTGGRGVGSAEGFGQLVEPLADALGAGIGATRAVVDAGWRPYDEQIGQTGKTVTPDLYVALGVSGAVQHLSGMNRAKVVVAINKDADAPIFKVADYGVVGDVSAVVPELTKAIGEVKG